MREALSLCFAALAILFGSAPSVGQATPAHKGGQSPCVYELLSLDISNEHYVRLLRACAPKNAADALLLEAIKRRGAPKDGKDDASVGKPNPVVTAIAASFSWLKDTLANIWWLTWPLSILALAVVASSIVRPLSVHVWHRDPPPALPGADIVIARNLSYTVSDADVDAAKVGAQTLWGTFANQPKRAMTAVDADPEALRAARAELAPYFDRAYAAMLCSQLRALRRTAGGDPYISLADLRVYYDRAVELGAGIALRDWIDYLDRLAFIDQAAMVQGAGMTTITITRLGRLFLGWCDVHNYSPQSLASMGRAL